MKANRYVAPALALTLVTAGCAEPPSEAPDPKKPSVERVELNHSLSPEAQARQIETTLNAGKKITGVTVEVGYEIPLMKDQIKEHVGAVALTNPIKVATNTFLYAESKDDSGLDVGVLNYSGKLQDTQPLAGRSPETPGEATVDLSAVYSEFPIDSDGTGAHVTTGRHYVISRNQEPGNNYNDQSLTASQLIYFGK